MGKILIIDIKNIKKKITSIIYYSKHQKFQNIK